MNVFILCAGRSGSASLIKACQHIDNYRCGHETLAGCVGDDRLDYPDNHIEADNRLTWYLGRLHFKFGDTAFYVHLKRDPEAVSNSFAIRTHVGMMNAFASGLLRQKVLSDDAQDPKLLAKEICLTANQNISHFLLDKSNKMEINIETIESDFEVFWDRIGATGDKQAAIKSFQQRAENTSAKFLKNRHQIGLGTRLKRAVKAAIMTYSVPNRDTSYFDRWSNRHK